MKIKALVTIVATRKSDGKSIEIKPDGVADIIEPQAERLIEQGYAEKAGRKAEEKGAVETSKLRKGDLRSATQTTRGGGKPERSLTRSRKDLLDEKGKDPDKEVGENGKGFDEGDGEDSNAE